MNRVVLSNETKDLKLHLLGQACVTKAVKQQLLRITKILSLKLMVELFDMEAL